MVSIVPQRFLALYLTLQCAGQEDHSELVKRASSINESDICVIPIRSNAVNYEPEQVLLRWRCRQ